MQATLQNGDAGRELDNLRLLESMGLEVCCLHPSGQCASLRHLSLVTCHLTWHELAGAVFFVEPLHRQAEPEIPGGHQHQAW